MTDPFKILPCDESGKLKDDRSYHIVKCGKAVAVYPGPKRVEIPREADKK